MKDMARQSGNEASAVPVDVAKQDAETTQRERSLYVKASIWRGRMLAALENGVKGGKWYSLIDKVVRYRMLGVAWSLKHAHRYVVPERKTYILSSAPPAGRQCFDTA